MRFVSQPSPPSRPGSRRVGRAGAKEAASPARGNSLRLRHGIVLLVLLILPALVAWRLPWSPWISFFYLVVVSGLNYRNYRNDKSRAQAGERRVRESTLHLLGLLGGWPGGFLARHRYRHKTAKASFRRAFWGIVVLHEAVALDYLLGWPGTRGFIALLTEFASKLIT